MLGLPALLIKDISDLSIELSANWSVLLITGKRTLSLPINTGTIIKPFPSTYLHQSVEMPSPIMLDGVEGELVRGMAIFYLMKASNKSVVLRSHDKGKGRE